MAIVRATAEEAGRDPAAIELSAMVGGRGDALLRRVEALAAVGVSRILVPPASPDSLAATIDEINGAFA